MCGLLKPTNGKIYYNDHSINNLGSKSNISYLSQNIVLLNNTIKNNIAFATEESEINIQKINYAIKNSEMDSFVKNLPKKEDTIIAESGGNFSGGQIQRIGIARALYNDSELIIFDEPTSALDLINSSKIMKLIQSIKKNRIIFVISHKSNELQFCDKIFNIKNQGLTEFINES